MSNTASVDAVVWETCRESWRVISDNSAGNSMRSTPAQSTAPSAVQLHSGGHSISSYFAPVVAASVSSSSSSSASRGAWQRTNTKAKSSTLRACMMECLGKAMSTLQLCCCTSTSTEELKTSGRWALISYKQGLIKASTCCFFWPSERTYGFLHSETVTSQCNYPAGLLLRQT